MATIRFQPLSKLASSFAISLIAGGLVILSCLPVSADTLRVIDGDTIVQNSIRIRLHGIDAPESKQICWKDNEWWKCGQAATDHLQRLISTSEVFCEALARDRYRRTIAKCFVGKLDLSAEMVRAGYALAYRRYSKDYVSDEEYAETNRNGLWAADFIQPWKWRRGKHARP